MQEKLKIPKTGVSKFEVKLKLILMFPNPLFSLHIGLISSVFFLAWYRYRPNQRIWHIVITYNPMEANVCDTELQGHGQWEAGVAEIHTLNPSFHPPAKTSKEAYSLTCTFSLCSSWKQQPASKLLSSSTIGKNRALEQLGNQKSKHNKKSTASFLHCKQAEAPLEHAN
jgi:hypothetical protein